MYFPQYAITVGHKTQIQKMDSTLYVMIVLFHNDSFVKTEGCSKLQSKEADKMKTNSSLIKKINVFSFDLNIKYHCCTLKVGLYFQTYFGVFLSVKIFNSYPY